MAGRKYSKTTSNKNGSVTYETGNHICEKEEVLNRLSVILIGNGKPEDGLAFRFAEFMKDHKTVVSNIEEIKSKVTQAIESSGKAIRAIETYKTEITSFENGKTDAEEKQKLADDLQRQKAKDRWQRWIWVIMAIIGFLSLMAGMYFGFKKISDSTKEIQGETKITNEILAPPGRTRGLIVIPINDTIKTK